MRWGAVLHYCSHTPDIGSGLLLCVSMLVSAQGSSVPRLGSLVSLGYPMTPSILPRSGGTARGERLCCERASEIVSQGRSSTVQEDVRPTKGCKATVVCGTAASLSSDRSADGRSSIAGSWKDGEGGTTLLQPQCLTCRPDAVVDPWLLALWDKILALYPLPPGLEVISPDVW